MIDKVLLRGSIKDTTRTDDEGRLTLGAVAKAKNYRVLINDAGQILSLIN